MYSIHKIQQVINGNFLQQMQEDFIKYLVYDSRNISFPQTSLFFALKTSHRDGHQFIGDAYKKGIRNFVVSESIDTNKLTDCNIILVADTLNALQSLASYHRSQFSIPVIGITGSNGKTIVKEWLYELLKDDYNIVRSPRSFNSQIGVPLSVWQLSQEHTLAIFEAGISESGEMQVLADMIQPTIGIFTNLGEAHDAGFSSREEKATEKLKLLQDVEVVTYQKETLDRHLSIKAAYKLEWSITSEAIFPIQIKKREHSTEAKGVFQNKAYDVIIPFTDDASVENAIHCWCVLLYFGYENDVINERFQRLHSIDMRLQLKHAVNHCLLINDSYSADLTSLKIALDFLQQQSAGLKRTVILSDFFGSENELYLYIAIADLLLQYRIEKLIAIGKESTHHLSSLLNNKIIIQTFSSVDNFLLDFKSSSFSHEIILLKGARIFQFERIAQVFEEKVHKTVLEVNLNALAHNLKEYQKVLQPGVKLMAMVKAFSYGSGGAEIASILQFHNVDYLGVAYADEGIELRKNGITLPIMVMNTDDSTFPSLIDYNLQPVLYSFEMLQLFQAYLLSQALNYYPVHLEIETGMNRLGFATVEIEPLIHSITASSSLKIESVFSHLAASEDESQDAFTQQQADLFKTITTQLQNAIPYPFLKHIANSAAIIRHPNLQMDMVRLGIGLYGIQSVTHQLNLEPVATLKSTVAQLKNVAKGESVSYNRRGVVNRDSIIATIRIGYADGYWRRFSNGVGKMWINGMCAPVMGTVCMDMTMIDVTDVPNVQVGDEVIVFGKQLPVRDVAAWAGTIPYEVMTGVSQRVKRIYYQE
ncbi:MAG: bifunctional UDP-N-acetylmuramoyl-tripeptide:D-alanyl-D-alanine ligase/alanine racemase [Chitinophagaceae bacterium]